MLCFLFERSYIARTNGNEEVVPNTSTVALRVVGEGKGTQCHRVKLGHSVSGGGGCKCVDPALQVGGVSNLKMKNIVMRPAGVGPLNDCYQQELQTTNLMSRKRRRLTGTNPQLCCSNNNFVLTPDVCFIPTETCRQIVRRSL
jgi:hypothetical protein